MVNFEIDLNKGLKLIGYAGYKEGMQLKSGAILWAGFKLNL